MNKKCSVHVTYTANTELAFHPILTANFSDYKEPCHLLHNHLRPECQTKNPVGNQTSGSSSDSSYSPARRACLRSTFSFVASLSAERMLHTLKIEKCRNKVFLRLNISFQLS